MTLPHEQSNPNIVPDFQQVNSAYAEVLAHNRSNTGMGIAMANLMIAMVNSANEQPSNEDDRSSEEIVVDATSRAQQKAVESDMQGELHSILHEDRFLRTGISLAPAGGEVGPVGGASISGKELKPRIQNVELFKEFLATVEPEDVAEVSNQALFSDVLSGLHRTIIANSALRYVEGMDTETRATAIQTSEDALRTFIAIEPEYERLGIDATSLRNKYTTKPTTPEYSYVSPDADQEKIDSYEAHKTYEKAQGSARTYADLESYVEYWGKDILPEYIEADRSQYVRDPAEQGFGPAQWHYDGGQPRWTDALSFIDRLSKEDRTKAFSGEVRAGLLRSVDTAIEEADDPATDEYKRANRDDLANIRLALTGQDYDIARFLEYTAKRTY